MKSGLLCALKLFDGLIRHGLHKFVCGHFSLHETITNNKLILIIYSLVFCYRSVAHFLQLAAIMGAKYVYHYFNGQGRGEAVRWIFALAGQDFEDHRIEGSEWAAFKSKTPYGTLPFLEVDGKTLGESLTIQRFLARKFHLVGKTEWENARVDELVDYVTDSRKTYPEWVDAQFFYNEPQKAEKIKEEYLKIAPRPLGKLQEILASNEQGRGYFIGDSPTWADISVACYLDTVERFREGFLNDYPLLKAHRERVRGLKGVKEWIEKRPKTEW